MTIWIAPYTRIGTIGFKDLKCRTKFKLIYSVYCVIACKYIKIASIDWKDLCCQYNDYCYYKYLFCLQFENIIAKLVSVSKLKTL